MSSESEGETGEDRGPVDVLYDPTADDKDTEWVEKKRKGRSSDAILSCPCCFSILCLECQQHPTQQNIYRAEFVVNCQVR